MWHSRPPPLHGEYHLKFPFWFFQPFPYLGIIPKKMCFFTVSLNLICINLGCGNYSWYTLPEIEHGRLCIVWNYIYSCISFDLNPVFFWKYTEIMLTKQIGVPEAWIIWMAEFLPCINARLLCWLNVRRRFVTNVCFIRMDILPGWTFCQDGRFVRMDVLSGRDILSGGIVVRIAISRQDTNTNTW